MKIAPTLTLLALVLIVATQCTRTPPAPLTQETVQRTVETWAKSQSFTGQVTADAPKISGTHASATLKFSNFHYTFEGEPRTFSDTGMASFTQDSGGRWKLDDVQLFQISDRQYPAFKANIEVK